MRRAECTAARHFITFYFLPLVTDRAAFKTTTGFEFRTEYRIVRLKLYYDYPLKKKMAAANIHWFSILKIIKYFKYCVNKFYCV